MITKNQPQQLGKSTLYYFLFQRLVTSAILSAIFIYWESLSPTPFFAYATTIVPVAIFVISLTFGYLYWKLYRYTVSDEGIETQSGVIVRSSKAVQFNDIQSANVVMGPILALFGLQRFQAFTSSPEQLSVVSDGRGHTRTVHNPDIVVVLDKDLATEIAALTKTNDVQKVKQVV